jgi:anion-transporting  ArsA/GET3 family ATPase
MSSDADAETAGAPSILARATTVRDREALRAIDEILSSRQLVLVTGKGGTGKSVVAAALALRARQLGLKPLLFECDAPRRPSLFPGGSPSTSELRELTPGVMGLNQSSDDAIRDYAIHALPSKTLAELMFENRVSRLFLKASPSVTEMALIGRMVQLAEERGHEGPVIVDLHSTGHALHVLRAPDGIMRVLRRGPVFDRAKAAKDFVYDPERTSVLTVALPEELPVTELLEFLDQLEETGVPLGPVFVNAMFEDPAPGVDDDVLKRLAAGPADAARASSDARTLREWARRAERERERLVAGLEERQGDARVLALPFVLDTDADTTLATRLAQHMVAVENGAEATAS